MSAMTAIGQVRMDAGGPTVDPTTMRDELTLASALSTWACIWATLALAWVTCASSPCLTSAQA